MKALRSTIALLTVSAMLAFGASFAQDHGDEHHDADQRHDNDEHHDSHAYVRHEDWKKGYHMRHEDWDRGEKIDYRTYHLRRPPAGYEWRLIDGNYVLAAVATGVIASVIVASTVH
jgi:Ni/Co efflux regulator RcnB